MQHHKQLASHHFQNPKMFRFFYVYLPNRIVLAESSHQHVSISHHSALPSCGDASVKDMGDVPPSMEGGVVLVP